MKDSGANRPRAITLEIEDRANDLIDHADEVLVVNASMAVAVYSTLEFQCWPTPSFYPLRSGSTSQYVFHEGPKDRHGVSPRLSLSLPLGQVTLPQSRRAFAL